MGGMSGQLKLPLFGSLCLLVALAGWSRCLVASDLVGLFFPFEGAVPRTGLSVSPALDRSLRDGAFSLVVLSRGDGQTALSLIGLSIRVPGHTRPGQLSS